MLITLSARCGVTLLTLSLASAACAADTGTVVAAREARPDAPAAHLGRPQASTTPTAPQEIEVRGAAQRESAGSEPDPYGVACSMHPIGFATHLDPSLSNSDGPDPFCRGDHRMLVIRLDASEPIDAPTAWWH